MFVDRWRARCERIYDSALARPRIGVVARAYQRYYDLGMLHIAGSVTYFGVLTLFPFLAFLYAAVAHVAFGDPQLTAQVDQAIDKGLGISNVNVGASFFSTEATASIQAVLGTLGVTGIIYAGRLWADGYRRALHAIWEPRRPVKIPFLWRYLHDVLVLLMMVAAMFVLIGFALNATGGPYKVLAAHGHTFPTWSIVLIRIAAALTTVGWAAFICAALFHRLGGAPRTPVVHQAALLAGICLGGLAIGGLMLLRHAFGDPFYGIVITMLGLMLWVSAAVRLTLALGVWAATASGEG